MGRGRARRIGAWLCSSSQTALSRTRQMSQRDLNATTSRRTAGAITVRYGQALLTTTTTTTREIRSHVGVVYRKSERRETRQAERKHRRRREKKPRKCIGAPPLHH